jgi:signal transduction histidine kinase
MESARSVVGVPLVAGGLLLGVLFADNFSRTDAFNDDDVRLLEALAVQIAIALQNVQLFEKLITEREQTRRFAHRVIFAQEEERQRVSRELHDEAGQALGVLKLSLQRIKHDLAGEYEALHKQVDDNITLTDETICRIRALSYDLRPPVLDTMELDDVLADYCRDFAARTRIPVDYRGIMLPCLPDTIKITLYRVLQEALTNAIKHAGANSIRVRLACDEGIIVLAVEDDGQGFDPDAQVKLTHHPKGIGLIGMRERLESVGGQLEIISQSGSGACITASIPLPERQRHDSCGYRR